MTRFWSTTERPEGFLLEELLKIVRDEIIVRSGILVGDNAPQVEQVLQNNIMILKLLTEAIQLADVSTRLLDDELGPSEAAEGGPPRIGEV